MRIFHDSRSTEYRAPYGALELGGTITLSLDVWDAPGAHVQLRTWIDGRGEGLYDMEPAVNAGGAERLVPADTVVCAIGQRSRTAVADELRDAAPYVRVVGDAVRPSNITTAVYEAWHAAFDIS